MSTLRTRRAVTDVIAHGLRGDLAQSAVGVELGQHLQSAITTDVGDGATPADIFTALREECGDDVLAYARLLELIVLAGLDELQVIAGLAGGLEPSSPAVPSAPPRRSPRRRR